MATHDINEECEACITRKFKLLILPQPCEACVVRLREDVDGLRQDRNDIKKALCDAAQEVIRLQKKVCSHATGPHNESCDLVSGLEQDVKRLRKALLYAGHGRGKGFSYDHWVGLCKEAGLKVESGIFMEKE